MFAAGEEPNGETVNTYHKPKRIETILEALDPEETQLVFHRLNRSYSESESDCNDLQADEEEEPDVSKPIPLLQMISMIEDTTHSPDDLIWDDKGEDDTVVKLAHIQKTMFVGGLSAAVQARMRAEKKQKSKRPKRR
ncbi:unnamed protein product, partial [Brassica oleracea]